MLARLRRWFRRPRPTGEECEVCNAPADHAVSDAWGDDEGRDGGTGMVAYYCAAHRPEHAVRLGR